MKYKPQHQQINSDQLRSTLSYHEHTTSTSTRLGRKSGTQHRQLPNGLKESTTRIISVSMQYKYSQAYKNTHASPE